MIIVEWQLLAGLQFRANGEIVGLSALNSFLSLLIVLIVSYSFTYLNILKDGCHRTISLQGKYLEGKKVTFGSHFLEPMSHFDFDY